MVAPQADRADSICSRCAGAGRSASLSRSLQAGRPPRSAANHGSRTASCVPPMRPPIPAMSIAVFIALFVLVYAVVFGAGIRYIRRLIKKGPEARPVDEPEVLANRPISAALEEGRSAGNIAIAVQRAE